MTAMKTWLRIILWVGASAWVLAASPWVDLVKSLDLVELAATFSEEKVDRILGEQAGDWPQSDRQAAAVMVAMAVLDPSDLADPVKTAAKVTRFQNTLAAPESTLLFSLNWPMDALRGEPLGGHDTLRQDAGLVDALNHALGTGIITGYSLRSLRVSEASDPARTIIYSHNDWRHVRQLVVLMSSEGLRGTVYLSRKVSAFIYRDGWGERPAWIAELGSGIYAAQGEEWLVQFEFERAADRARFHELVTRYAKKDAPDETGNLVHAWWQPFYYSEVAMEGFFEIGRVTIEAAHAEVSLLALTDNLPTVRDHFAPMRWPIEVDRIWVPGPFFRFLQGDYK